jgi:molybdate transport system substrate-binding protein
VSAAASLRGAFTRYGASFGQASFSFAGSDQLAAQIRAGAHPDVFASANTTLPDSLYKAHLVQRPVPFATNTLVLAVPAHGGRVTSLAGAGGSGVKLVIGAPTVPVGAYTLKVLGRLGAQGRTILSRAVSQEPSVDGIVGKLVAGAADAGFVYITDVSASHGALRAIALPAAAKPSAVYEAAVVTGSSQAERARTFVAGLVSGAGRAALAAAGFGSPPRSR